MIEKLLSGLAPMEMIEKLLNGLVPTAVKEIKKIPRSQKILIALWIKELCESFIDEDQAGFEILIAKTKFPDEWKNAINGSVWDHGDYQS